MAKQVRRRFRHRMSSRIGMAITAVGVLVLTFGLFTGNAGAWEGSCYDAAPSPGAWTEMKARLSDADINQLKGAGQVFTDGTLSVVISDVVAADSGQPLTTANIGSLDYTSNWGIEAIYIRAGGTNDVLKLYSPAVTAGSALHATNSAVPIDWVTFCYNPQNVPTTTAPTTTCPSSSTTSTTTTSTTSTTRPTTTTASSTTTTASTTTRITGQVLPESTVGPTTTQVPTEVLGVQVARPQVLAFTGGHEKRWAMLGLIFVGLGLALMLVDRIALRPRDHA